MTFTVTLVALPERLRPSDGITAALAAMLFAAIGGPGTLWNVPLIWISTRGIV
jgi:hypothetical protein